LRTLKSMPAYWEAERKALYAEMGDPEKDEKMLRDISPLFHSEGIKKPLLVLQGANDPRVLQVESDEMVKAVQQRGVPCQYLIFPDEGHGFTKRKNEEEGYEAVLAFLDQYLRGPQ
jgi:dipeptidyl aminopeptidase/acylaminoacyl peptidase